MQSKAQVIRAINEQLLSSQRERRESMKVLSETKTLVECKEIVEVAEADQVSLKNIKLTDNQLKELENALEIAKSTGCLGLLENDFSEMHLPLVIAEINKVEEIKKFNSFIFSRIRISEKGIKYIIDHLNETIIDLDLSRITDENLQYLVKKRKFVKLKIFDSSVTDEGLKFLLENNFDLLELNICGSKRLTAQSGKYLAQHRGLQILFVNNWVARNNLNDFLCNLAKSPSLRKLHLCSYGSTEMMTFEVAYALREMRNLSFLDVARMKQCLSYGSLHALLSGERIRPEKRMQAKERFSALKFQVLMGIKSQEDFKPDEPVSSLLLFSKEKIFDPKVLPLIFQFCEETPPHLDVITDSKESALIKNMDQNTFEHYRIFARRFSRFDQW